MMGCPFVWRFFDSMPWIMAREYSVKMGAPAGKGVLFMLGKSDRLPVLAEAGLFCELITKKAVHYES